MYQIIQSETGSIIVLEQDGVLLSFSENPENTDYQRYLEWVAAGGVPEVIEP
jgi:hypothetical protein